MKIAEGMVAMGYGTLLESTTPVVETSLRENRVRWDAFLSEHVGPAYTGHHMLSCHQYTYYRDETSNLIQTKLSTYTDTNGDPM